MKIEQYNEKALGTLMDGQAYGDINAKLMDQVLGLVGESGEVAEKFKKLIRDKQGQVTQDDTAEIIKELGDVLWYITTISHLLGASLEEVAQVNLAKLASRQKRSQLGGSGDNR